MTVKRKRRTHSTQNQIILKGETICPGIGIGPAHLVDHKIVVPKRTIKTSMIQAEQKRYTCALEIVRGDLHKHIELAHSNSHQDAILIFEMHRTMLADERFHENVRKQIADEHKNAEWATQDVAEQLMAQFESMKNPYLQTRVEDVRDMAGNVLAALIQTRGARPKTVTQIGKSPVLVSEFLHPSAAMEAQRLSATGLATESRAFSSHAAVLLKGHGIPTVGGVDSIEKSMKEGDELIVDGLNSLVVVRPRAAIVKKYRSIQKELSAPPMSKPAIRCTTREGTPIRLMANIENPDQVRFMIQNGLDGIGLFRTEFFVLSTGRFPDEEEQYSIYRQAVDSSAGRRVVIRTFDFGADKCGDMLDTCGGQNPALGIRGIRRHLSGHTEELRTQIRAILRAAQNGDVGILIPMVSTPEDIIAVKQHIEEAKKDLRRESVPFSEDTMLGAMVEIPAAAIAMNDILSEVDFVSIGTNDLLQYFMAADRDNERVLKYNDIENRAFLWLLQFMIERATEIGRQDDITVCGEVASRPDFIPRLLAFGYRSFSISPVAAASVRKACAGTDLAGA